MAGLKTQRDPTDCCPKLLNARSCKPLKLLTIVLTVRTDAVHYDLHKDRITVPNLSHINTIHALPKHLTTNHFNIIPPPKDKFSKSLLPSGFPTKTLYAPPSTKRATGSTHFVLFYFINRLRTGEDSDHEATSRAISVSSHSLLTSSQTKYLVQQSTLKHCQLSSPFTALPTLLVTNTNYFTTLN
jgi:hypothetical protein